MELTSVVKRFRVKWSLWKFIIAAFCNVIVSSICYYMGFHLSRHGAAMPLARSGAAATIVAIAFTLYDYDSALDISEKKALLYFEKLTSIFPVTGKKSLDEIRDKLRRNTSFAKRWIKTVQVAVLMFATFLWGFGDLLGSWLISQ